MKKVQDNSNDCIDQILKVLIRMEERLKVIEESVKKEETTKQILND